MPRQATPAPALAGGEAPVTVLPGVGPAVAEKLAARGLSTLQDLWFLLPLRYEDRTRLTPIRELRPGAALQAEGRVRHVERTFRGRPVLKVVLDDGHGDLLQLRFFHFRAQQAQAFQPGRRVRVFGEVRPGPQGWEMVHPGYRLLGEQEAPALDDRLTPVYPAVEGLGPGTLARLVRLALERLPASAALELLPAGAGPGGLPGLREALLTVHRPPADADTAALLSGTHPAQQRLAFEELLAHALSLRRQRLALREQGATPLPPAPAALAALRATLPFALTGAQERVLAEVAADLARPQPMLRLVQGDVGSGKTVVAALAAMQAVAAGRQVALMAPTELLAEQHLQNFRRWLEPHGIAVRWLAGKVTGKARRETLAELALGHAQVVVGTHALMQEGVAFARLGLVIVDEQHRFGVHQRLALRDKGLEGERVPHQLVMTATPIPRTLAMTAYADLDLSVIDELPPGRSPVTTVAMAADRRPALVARVRAACAEGRQAYWVCPLIEESEEVEAQAAQTTFEQLSEALPELRVGLLHGRMKPAEKQAVMRRFKEGGLQLLVATTVIEVGVDVPNASLMVIENAERLGLAQLHQLRGRVGRGSTASSCVLLYQPPLGAIARERLEVMRRSSDGFVIAEKDLELRGPGELLGTRQTGLAAFRIADLVRDAHLLPAVHGVAERLLAETPALAEALIARWVGSAARYAAA
ncbi:ATP-dependent DNA helicase RecG [Silanimonas lenta]|uniref:ATP-dependent DNA helicase RecG n=1 Tax=Silanimonas lenta TaxID=265429 RepID=UPI0004180EE4|nr:ATP-dependent DNA helicase RecG [Silanimonas lenta]